MTTERERWRSTGLEALAVSVTAVTAPVIDKHGAALGRIVAEWASIAGDQLAARTLPERLARPTARGRDAGAANPPGGTLHVRVASGGAAMELQHLEPVILERIASILGFRAAARLRFSHAPVPAPRAASHSAPTFPSPPLDPATEARLLAAVADVAAPELREALLSLGRCVSAPARRER